jgi:ribosomal protein L40E
MTKISASHQQFFNSFVVQYEELVYHIDFLINNYFTYRKYLLGNGYMKICKKCKTENPDDSEYCTKCGRKFENNKVKTEKKPASTLERIGKAAERTIEHTAHRVETKYEKTFGVFGPLIQSFLGLIIFRLIIFLMTASRETIPLLGIIGEFLYSYLLVFFVLILVGNYTTYLNKKYKQHIQWIVPLISTVTFIVTIWILAELAGVIGEEINRSVLISLGSFVQQYIIVIALVVLLLSYGFKLVSHPFTQQ